MLRHDLRWWRLGDRTPSAVVPASCCIAESADPPAQFSCGDQARKQLFVQPSQLRSLGGCERIEQLAERFEPSPLDLRSDLDTLGCRGNGNGASVGGAPSFGKLAPLQFVDQAHGRGMTQSKYPTELLDRATFHKGRQGNEPSWPLAGARGGGAGGGPNPIGDSQRQGSEEICLTLALMHAA